LQCVQVSPFDIKKKFFVFIFRFLDGAGVKACTFYYGTVNKTENDMMSGIFITAGLFELAFPERSFIVNAGEEDSNGRNRK
jgi:hypothetical protein